MCRRVVVGATGLAEIRLRPTRESYACLRLPWGTRGAPAPHSRLSRRRGGPCRRPSSHPDVGRHGFSVAPRYESGSLVCDGILRRLFEAPQNDRGTCDRHNDRGKRNGILRPFGAQNDTGGWGAILRKAQPATSTVSVILREAKPTEGSHRAWGPAPPVVSQLAISRKILPLWVGCLDQGNLLFSCPPLDLLLSRDGSGNIRRRLEVRQLVEVVPRCERGSIVFQPVFMNSRVQIAGDTGVEDRIVAVCHDVNGGKSASHRGIPWRNSRLAGEDLPACDRLSSAVGFFAPAGLRMTQGGKTRSLGVPGTLRRGAGDTTCARGACPGRRQ
jgi:hypothetical protein